MQVILLVVMSGVIVAGAGSFGLWRWRVAAEQKREDAERAERARKQVPFLAVAPTPLPTGSLLSGPDEVDADGYPRKFVSQVGLRSLFHHGKYAELTAALEEYQAAFERDPRTEYWIHDAVEAFESAERELDPKFDAWVAATPTSFAPYLARAAHRVGIGFFERGTKWAKDTPESSFAAMNREFADADKDLTQAMARRSKLVAALRLQIRMRSASSTSHGDREVAAATADCPTCFLVRVAFLGGLEPRWGGSYAEMDRYANSAPVSENPRLRFLKGYADIDRARVAQRDDKNDEALALVERACALGEFWLFLAERARARRLLDDNEHALVDISRADALRPHVSTVLFERALIHERRHDWELAGVDLLEGLRIDPTESRGTKRVPHVVKGLEHLGEQHARAGRREDALRVLDLAAELDPTNQKLLRRRTAVVSGTIGTADAGAGTDLDALEERARAAPDDFRAQQALDYALARQGKYERVVEVWTAYLARHPNDGKAYLERGGAYHHLGRQTEARADAVKACDLGLNEGCVHAKRIPAH